MKKNNSNNILMSLHDLHAGFKRWELWVSLATRELRQGYYGSFFGRFWITLSLGIFVLIVGNVYTLVLKMDGTTYIPFLCSGLVCWRLITHMISEASSVFVKSQGYIKGFALPMSIFVYRSVLKNLIIFFHYLLVFVVVSFIYPVDINLYTLLCIPGLLIVALNGFWFVALFGLLCARFRDLQQLLNSMTILFFFVTPVFWPEEMIESYRGIVIFNPFYHFLELIRSPLLGSPPDTLSWLVGIGLALFGFLITIPVFARFKSRLVYWL